MGGGLTDKHFVGVKEGIYLEGNEQEESFNAVKAPIHKVPQKEIVCLWAFASNFKQLFEIIKLPVNVATDLKIERRKMCKKRR